MYYFGNSLAIKDIAFLIFYALCFKCELIHMHIHVFFSQNLGSHILIYRQGYSVLCPIYTY